MSQLSQGKEAFPHRIGIPVWEGKVSPLLDTASRLLVCQVQGDSETSRFETFLESRDLTGKCSRINALGIDKLICGAVSRPFQVMLTASGVDLIPWISGDSEAVLAAYRNGRLNDPRFLMPGRTDAGPVEGVKPKSWGDPTEKV